LFSSEATWKDAWFFEVLILAIVVAINSIRWALPYYSARAKLLPGAARSISQKRTAISNGNATPGFHRPSRPSSASSGSGRSAPIVLFKEKIHPEHSSAIELEGDVLDEVDMPNINPAILDDYASSNGGTGSFTRALEFGYTAEQKLRHEATIQELFSKAAGPQKARSELVSRHGDASDASSAASSLDLVKWEGVSLEELRYIVDSGAWGCLLLVLTLFTFGATTAFKAVACRRWNDKVSILVEDPSISCYSPEHWAMLGVALPMIAVNVFIPIFLVAYVLLHGRRAGVLQDEGFCSRFGFLLERYELEYCWWEIVVLLRKLTTALVTVFLHDDINLQVILLSVVYTLAALFTVYLRPFKQEQHNVLDAVLHFSLVIMLLMIFINPTDILLLSQFSEVRESFHVFLQIAVLLLMVTLCTRAIRNDIVSNQIPLPTSLEFVLVKLHAAQGILHAKVRSVVDNLVRRTVEEHQR
jgi:hypothetical protein